MTEVERLIHLIASMQILFGSRRGGWLVPLLIVGVIVGGWYGYRYAYSPERAVEQAHQLWDSGVSRKRIEAIKQYKALLQKTDPLDPGRRLVTDDRDTLYRRIVVHEFKFEKDEEQAAEWILRAWDEQIRDLRIQDEMTKTFWDNTIESLKLKARIKEKNRNGKFDTIPGIDAN